MKIKQKPPFKIFNTQTKAREYAEDFDNKVHKSKVLNQNPK